MLTYNAILILHVIAIHFLSHLSLELDAPSHRQLSMHLQRSSILLELPMLHIMLLLLDPEM